MRRGAAIFAAICVMACGVGAARKATPARSAVQQNARLQSAPSQQSAAEQPKSSGQPSAVANAKPATSLLNLSDTMKLIQDRLNGIGAVNFIAYATDSATGFTEMKHISHEWSKVAADAKACRISYHWKAASEGQVFQDADHVLLLKDVEQVAVLTGQQAFQADLTQAGHQELRARVDPDVFVLEARRPSPPGSVRAYAADSFFFGDEEAANRAAEAMRHAVDLCGGGKTSGF